MTFFPIKKIIAIFCVYAVFAIIFESAKQGVSFVHVNTDLPVIYSNGDLEKKVEELLNIGMYHNYIGDYQKGNILMDSATLLIPRGSLFQQKVSTNLLMGNYKPAFIALDDAINAGYDYSLGYRAWAKMHYLKDYKGAIKDFEEYDALSPEPSYAFAMSVQLLKGMAKKQMGDLKGAIAEYDAYIANEESAKLDVYVYLHRGIAYFEMGNLEKALLNYEYFLEEYPEGPEVHFHKGKVLLEKAQTQEACQCFETALKQIKKGYTRGYIWNEIPEQLYKSEVLEYIDFHCPK